MNAKRILLTILAIATFLLLLAAVTAGAHPADPAAAPSAAASASR